MLNTRFWRCSIRLLILVVLFVCQISGCAGSSKARKTIVLKQEKVFVAPLQDSSKIIQMVTFPQNAPMQQILLSRFDEIQQKFSLEVQKYATTGQYEVVSDSQAATAMVRLRFWPAELKGSELILPGMVWVKKNADGQETQYKFSVVSEPLLVKNLDNFHFWGELLDGIKRNFPFSEFSELFYPAENANSSP